MRWSANGAPNPAHRLAPCGAMVAHLPRPARCSPMTRASWFANCQLPTANCHLAAARSTGKGGRSQPSASREPRMHALCAFGVLAGRGCADGAACAISCKHFCSVRLIALCESRAECQQERDAICWLRCIAHMPWDLYFFLMGSPCSCLIEFSLGSPVVRESYSPIPTALSSSLPASDRSS